MSHAVSMNNCRRKNHNSAVQSHLFFLTSPILVLLPVPAPNLEKEHSLLFYIYLNKQLICNTLLCIANSRNLSLPYCTTYCNINLRGIFSRQQKDRLSLSCYRYFPSRPPHFFSITQNTLLKGLHGKELLPKDIKSLKVSFKIKKQKKTLVR